MDKFGWAPFSRDGTIEVVACEVAESKPKNKVRGKKLCSNLRNEQTLTFLRDREDSQGL